MKVYRVIGSEIGINQCGAIYYTTRREANERKTQFRKEHPQRDCEIERVEITNARGLADELNGAMGYGCS